MKKGPTLVGPFSFKQPPVVSDVRSRRFERNTPRGVLPGAQARGENDMEEASAPRPFSRRR